MPKLDEDDKFVAFQKMGLQEGTLLSKSFQE